MGQWVVEREDELLALLQPARGQLPSTSTLRRALRAVDLAALERQVAPALHPPDAGPGLVGVAVDGKLVRGATQHGVTTHLVSAVRHQAGVVLGQVAAASRIAEVPAAQTLLAGRDLTGVVITGDALFTQRGFAHQIRQQGGHYFLVVKGNQPQLHEAIAAVFAQPPPPLPSDCVAQTKHTAKGHGRLDTRIVSRTAALQETLAELGWPDVGQVVCRTTRRLTLKTGVVQEQTTYAITSLTPDQATVTTVAALWRGHWTIENQVHYPRDVSYGEDACQVRVGHAPQALATLRNALLNHLRHLGWTQIPDALRHYAAYPTRALRCLGALPPQL